jgi:hypothetical protein
MVFDHVVADTNHYVGFFKTEGYPISRLQPDSSQRQLMGKGDGGFGHERVATGICNLSAKAINESDALALITPLPATMIGHWA